MPPAETAAPEPSGPVLFAYDGSELAAFAIERAGHELLPGRAAIVVCVWQPADVGFTPIDDRHFDADAAQEVQAAAERTAAHGAVQARQAGFVAESLSVEAAPTWQGIVETAAARGATLIVLGSHRHGGLAGRLLGSVASAVVAHAESSVLIVHRRS
jgi:nucleotide-binding universal stress UspA family protein